MAWRSEGMLPGHRLRRLTIELAGEGRATIVRPARLHEQEVGSLLEASDLGDAAPDIQRRVYLESEGLPLFVAEYLAALRSGGDPAELDLPQEVRGLLDARLQPLGPVARQVLGAAATIGRSFHVDIVREASGRGEEETIGALEELVTQGLVREVAGTEPIYDFSHQTLRDVVYEQTGLARRRLLHRRVAAAFLKGRTDSSSEALVAQHLRRAGDNIEAAEHYVLAAEQAAALHANADALEYFEAALALGHPATAELHERIGDLRMLRGDYAGALASLETAAAHSQAEASRQVRAQAGRGAPSARRMGTGGGPVQRGSRRYPSGGAGDEIPNPSGPRPDAATFRRCGASGRARPRRTRAGRGRPETADPRRRLTTCSGCSHGTTATSTPL